MSYWHTMVAQQMAQGKSRSHAEAYADHIYEDARDAEIADYEAEREQDADGE